MFCFQVTTSRRSLAASKDDTQFEGSVDSVAVMAAREGDEEAKSGDRLDFRVYLLALVEICWCNGLCGLCHIGSLIACVTRSIQLNHIYFILIAKTLHLPHRKTQQYLLVLLQQSQEQLP